VLTGTTAFRLDKVAAYLSDDGAEQYFTRGLRAGYNSDDARRFADAILEEVLGSYASPDVRYQTHGQYLSDAFRVRANRARADRNYLSLIRQIGTFWGTLLAVGGYSRGESFVARNVGLKSYWHEGQWKVRIIFMDHDALVISGPEDRGFQANGSLQCMRLDETYIFGRANHFATSEIGYLRNIYRVGRRVSDEGDAVIRTALLDAYKKTRHAMLTNPKLRTFFHGEFVKQICDWDTMAAGYAKLNGDKAEWAGWKRRMTKMLKVRGYRPPRAFQRYLSVLEKHKAFIERYSFLYDSDNV
jgi:hypothetical protein